MNAQHTPGPWTIEEYGDDEAPALVIHKDSESRVCFMATPGSHGDPARIEADAHLIAAAPDLLTALKVLLNEAENFSVSGVYFSEKCMGHKGPDLAHAAIAKAEGEPLSSTDGRETTAAQSLVPSNRQNKGQDR